MATQKKAPAKKRTAKAPAKASSTKKTAAVRGAAKPASKTVKKAPAKTGPKSVTGKKTAFKRTTVKSPNKTTSRAASTSAAKKAAPGRRYAPAASKQVAAELHEMHEGKLTIGKSKQKVTNPKQAIAIGLAEARRAGADVPPNPHTGK